MSSVANEITKALDENAEDYDCGCACATPNCNKQCLQFSSIVARLGIFQYVNEGVAYSANSNVPLTTNCAGDILQYSSISARQGVFSSILITNNIQDYINVPVVTNNDGFVHLYDTFVATDAYFLTNTLTQSYTNFSTVCATYEQCATGPTGPRGPRGPTGPAGPSQSSIYTSSLYIGPSVSTASYSLQLGVDSAAKPATTTWTIASDRRIKHDIQSADLEKCYDVMRNIPLRYFTWDPIVYNSDVTRDRHSLGFIAQEVVQYFPKSVDVLDNCYGFSSFHTLNTDQLYKAHIGATKQMMNVVEGQQNRISTLEGEKSGLDERVHVLESTLTHILTALRN